MAKIIEIDDLALPELAIYQETKEVRLYHYFEPEQGIFIAESTKVALRAYHAGYTPISLLMGKTILEGEAQEFLQELAKNSEYDQIPIYVGPEELLKHVTGLKMTRGLLCAMRRKELPSLEEVCRDARRIAVLEDVENPTNVGAVFRSAAALGMDAVILTADSSDPLYRRSARVSMGTVFQIPWTVLKKGEWPDSGMHKLKELGFSAAAMALKTDSVSIDNPELMAEEKLAILIGNEGNGLKADTIDACDYTVMIPMAAGVDSLNAAAASAVAFWQLGRH